MTTMAELLDLVAKAESDVVSGNLRVDTPLLQAEDVRCARHPGNVSSER